jgi:hypothetical protein
VEPLKDLLTAIVVSAVTFVWVVVFLASIFTREYTPLIYASGPMLACVGYATGVQIIRKGVGNA